ncbi:MAG: hypothetical protein PHS44_07930 [Candidatus Dojkabacteria bacterium]|nr:hypothetical protein [Candidatus Dojkabacteria bacterium]
MATSPKKLADVLAQITSEAKKNEKDNNLSYDILSDCLFCTHYLSYGSGREGGSFSLKKLENSYQDLLKGRFFYTALENL